MTEFLRSLRIYSISASIGMPDLREDIVTWPLNSSPGNNSYNSEENSTVTSFSILLDSTSTITGMDFFIILPFEGNTLTINSPTYTPGLRLSSITNNASISCDSPLLKTNIFGSMVIKENAGRRLRVNESCASPILVIAKDCCKDSPWIRWTFIASTLIEKVFPGITVNPLLPLAPIALTTQLPQSVAQELQSSD